MPKSERNPNAEIQDPNGGGAVVAGEDEGRRIDAGGGSDKASAKGAEGRVLGATRIWRAGAWVAGVFTVLVAVVMLVSYQRGVAEDPLRVSQLQGLRERLHADPKNEEVKKEIRELDLRERERHFARVRRNRVGAWLLAIGSTVFLVSVVRSRKPQVHGPRTMLTPAEIEAETRRGRLASGIAGGVVVISLAMVGLTHQPVKRPASVEGAAVAVASAAATTLTPEILKQHWPRFRGWDGSGVAGSTNIPAQWNAETGENIAWKVALPLKGHSSPVIWGNRIFLSGGSGTERELFCVDVASGAVLWRLPSKLLSVDAVRALEIPNLSGAASPTVTADDKHVFAIFATGELLAADHHGKLLWTKNFGKLENMYGHATSLIMHGSRLIVQLDQAGEEDGKSRLYAFDGATGNVVWQQKRALPSSWATPIIVTAAGRDQIIALGEPWLISYDAADGKELWKYHGLGSDITPSPVEANGLVVVISPNQRLFALRPDGQGDITKTHVAWAIEENIPDIASPVFKDGLLFSLETGRNLTCFDAATGTKIWDHAYEGEFQASPSIAGEHLYLFNTDGNGYTVKAGREFKELGQIKIGEPVRSSPAFVGDMMILRGETNLFCIRKGGKP